MPRFKSKSTVKRHMVHGSVASYHSHGKTFNASKAGKKAAYARARAFRKGK